MALKLVYPQDAEEEEALLKFREEIKDLPLDNDVEDHFLLRWLRARNLNIPRAKEMLSNYLDFMDSEGSKLENWNPPSICTENIFHKYIGNEDEGRPVYWLPIGTKFDPRPIIESRDKESLMRYLHQCLQHAMRVIDRQRERTQATQVISIVDMEGFTYSKFYNVKTIQTVIEFVKEFEAYYPEILFKAFVINAPRVFYWFFNMVKPFLSTHTLGKMEFYTTDANKWKPALLESIPRSVLPIEYGGTGESLLSYTVTD